MIDNFVLEYNNFIDDNFCDSVITYFENMKNAGLVENRSALRNTKSHLVDDSNIALHGEYAVDVTGTQNITSTFLNKFWNTAYQVYTNKYSILSEVEPHKIYFMKCQKSEIGQGYHNWHFESSGREVSNRVLAYILYLNDVNEGGETEFLYYPKRVSAKKGKLVLFPGSFSHTHRGNPPISGVKYILTGWVEF